MSKHPTNIKQNTLHISYLQKKQKTNTPEVESEPEPEETKTPPRKNKSLKKVNNFIHTRHLNQNNTCSYCYRKRPNPKKVKWHLDKTTILMTTIHPPQEAVQTRNARVKRTWIPTSILKALVTMGPVKPTTLHIRKTKATWRQKSYHLRRESQKACR